MRERPILFSAPMVRALLDGIKTQTRRVVKMPRGVFEPVTMKRMVDFFDDDGGPHRSAVFDVQGLWLCPYGTVGDRLWVRETHAIVPATAYRCSTGIQQTVNPSDTYESAIYREGFDLSTGGLRWRSSIYMPRWASRITLTITDVRVQRLQEISEAAAMAEGVGTCGVPGHDDCYYGSVGHRCAFEELWDSLNAKRAPWSSNPWVWAITFKRETA